MIIKEATISTWRWRSSPSNRSFVDRFPSATTRLSITSHLAMNLHKGNGKGKGPVLDIALLHTDKGKGKSKGPAFDIQIQIHLFKQKSGHTGHKKTLRHAQQKKITEQRDTQAYVNSTRTKGVKSTNSSLCLNAEILQVLTTSLDKLFQILITRYAKLYFRTSRLHWGLNNLKLRPLVMLLVLILLCKTKKQVSCNCVYEQYSSTGVSDLIRLVWRASSPKISRRLA